MPTIEEVWREYLRANSDLLNKQRQQSQAFIRGEGLAVIPLKHASKIIASGTPALFENWADIDHPQMVNWAAKFPPRSKAGLGCDIDVDVKPHNGEWTAEHEHNAGIIAKHVIGGLKVFGIDIRHRWGRASQQGWGHVYTPINAVSKEDINKLLLLNMKRPVSLGAYKVRVEVRISPDNKTPTGKPFTLPGSTYPSRRNPDDLDILVWTKSPDLGSDFTFPALTPVAIPALVKGLYTGLLTALMAPHWEETARHDLALQVSGVLAREVHDDPAIFDEGDAEDILHYLCTAVDDDETADRLKTLKASLKAVENNQHVTGYTRLSETIGEDGRDALIRLRGGSDPDEFADLLENIAYAPFAVGRENVYLNLSTKGRGTVICDKNAIIEMFRTDPRYRNRTIGRKEVPLIELVINSKKRQQYHSGVDLPGIPFGQLVVRDTHGWREANEQELLTPRELSINIGPGFATPILDEEPDLKAWNRWCRLWDRHLVPLTSGDPKTKAKLEKAIAWCVQYPLEKIPLGLLITGGGGIGKSAMVSIVLKPVLGNHVVASTNIAQLDTSYRVSDLEGKKLYIFEELDLSKADNSMREFIKDLMKNPTMRVNKKYGREYEADNFAIPVFLTNAENPGLVSRGAHERSLAVIQGHTQDNLHMTAAQWQAHRNIIASHIKEFSEAMRDPDVRAAAMFYFANLEVERTDFEDNSDVGDVVDRRENLTALEEAICDMVEKNALHPKLTGETHWPLTLPFKTDTIMHWINQRGPLKNVTSHAVYKRMRQLFGDDESVKPHRFQERAGKTAVLYYFTLKPGSMIDKLEAALGVKLHPIYQLEADDYGVNPAPPAEQCQTAWDLDITQYPYGSSKF